VLVEETLCRPRGFPRGRTGGSSTFPSGMTSPTGRIAGCRWRNAKGGSGTTVSSLNSEAKGHSESRVTAPCPGGCLVSRLLPPPPSQWSASNPGPSPPRAPAPHPSGAPWTGKGAGRFLADPRGGGCEFGSIIVLVIEWVHLLFKVSNLFDAL